MSSDSVWYVPGQRGTFSVRNSEFPSHYFTSSVFTEIYSPLVLAPVVTVLVTVESKPFELLVTTYWFSKSRLLENLRRPGL